jgi:hypothetical protein
MKAIKSIKSIGLKKPDIDIDKNTLIVAGAATILLAAGVTWYFLNKKNKAYNAKKPPRNAPQLDLENPGIQSDFPVAASVSELG